MQTPSVRTEDGHAPAPGIRLQRARGQQSRFDHAACDFKTFTNSREMIFSSPGCNMKEFIDNASPCSPDDRTMDGVAPRRAALASRGVNVMRDASHLMYM